MNKISKKDFGEPIGKIFSEELRKGHSVRMNIKGKCMHPFIKLSDIVTVKPIKFDETKIGDVIVYSRNIHHEFTVHRLIKYKRDKDDKEFILSIGDANRFGDFPVYPDEVYGKVESIERRDGRIIYLDSKNRHFQGYMLAKRTWLLSVMRMFFKSPHIIPSRVIHKIKNFYTR